ncbi:MAG: SpoIIE family protein phosphatase [Desulfovibrionaceae bacterium]
MDDLFPQHRLKVLAADDSQAFRSFLVNFLQRDYDIRTAEDGLDCLEQMESFCPDVLLVDLAMPRMGGLEVIEKLRSLRKDDSLYIIVLTGDEDAESKPRALDLGANDYLTKPFDKQELLARVRAAGRQVMLYARLREAYASIQGEMRLVAHLQSLLLPKDPPKVDGLDFEHWYRPSAQSSGDYYDYMDMGQGMVRLAVADVSGHGARAAFLMGMVRTLLRESVRQRLPLHEAVRAVNVHLCEVLASESDYVTLFAADLDLNARSMTYLNAGHCPGLLSTQAKRTARLQPQTPPLGFFPLDFQSKKVRIGDRFQLFLFTDGFYEWDLAPGEQLGLDRFLELASELMQQEDFSLSRLDERLSALTGASPEYRDDLTALKVKWSARA